MEVRLKITGKVQGVGFRYAVKRRAEELNLAGYVRNIPDAVEVVAQGSREILENLIGWTKRGPSYARVNEVKVEWREPQEQFQNFEIRD